MNTWWICRVMAGSVTIICGLRIMIVLMKLKTINEVLLFKDFKNL
jgi:hypothetical protein